jgi:hypothetical protein
VTLGGHLVLQFRELRPSDFYFFGLIENDHPDITQTHLSLLLIKKLGGLSDDDLSAVPGRYVRPLVEWMGLELLNDRVMKVDQWLELAFHLCKQRWDSSVEWLEQQPVSKILLMAKIQSEFITKQNEETKRAARKRK